MIKLTQAAVDQIKSSNESNQTNSAFRIAVKKNNDGSLEYGMGFDDVSDDDTKIEYDGLLVVVSELSRDLLEDCVIDYVALKEGSHHFIFLNPQDPNYVPPTEGGIEHVPLKFNDK